MLACSRDWHGWGCFGHSKKPQRLAGRLSSCLESQRRWNTGCPVANILDRHSGETQFRDAELRLLEALYV
jgi:hypothetical protein